MVESPPARLHELRIDPTQVPDGWRIARLADVAEVVMGQSPPGSTVLDCDDERAHDRGLPFIQGTAEFGCPFPVPRRSCIRPLKTARPGDCLISVRAPVGDTNRVDQAVAIGRGLAAVRFVGADPCFGWYALNHAKAVLKRLTQGSTFEAIGRVDLQTLSVPIPPRGEQRAIAAVLNSIDEAIERTNEAIAATERLRNALLDELLTRGLPCQHSEWKEVPRLGTIPASWDAVPLREVLVLNQPGAWGDDVSPNGERVRVLRAADLTRDGRVKPEGAAWRQLSPRDQARRLMRDGDLMLERSGGGPGAPVGRVALIERMGPVYCNNFCQQLRVDHDRLSPNYTLRALWHRYIRGVTARLEHQTTGIRNLDFDGYLSFPIPLPPLQEQRVIAAVLDSVDAAIEKARAERCDLRSLQASTADALLTGRVRVDQ